MTTKAANKPTAEWLTLQQVRNLTGLCKRELNELLDRIGHVAELGEGVRKTIELRSFYRAWFESEREPEDEYVKRKRIAQALHAENQAELSKLELQERTDEVVSAEEYIETMEIVGNRHRILAEQLGTVSIEAQQLAYECLEKIRADFERTEPGHAIAETNGTAKKPPAKPTFCK